MFPILEKQKYFDLMRKNGYSAALTALHHDMEELEQSCFENPEGYNPQIWEVLRKWRQFSMELWNFRYNEPTPKNP